MITIQDLSKAYDGVYVLRNFSLEVKPGEVVAIIGPNGSGKTTLLNILCRQVNQTHGTFTINTDRVGIAMSRKGFFSDMSVLNNFKTLLFPNHLTKDELNDLFTAFNIDYQSKLYGSLSAGMQQRATIALAFARNNDLIFLDEPFNHLDIDSGISLRQRIINEKDKKKTILMTSHLLGELEELCNKVIFLVAGQIVMQMETAQLVNQYGSVERAYTQIIHEHA